MFGLLNLHKPFGLTSHDCVAKVRRLLQLKRVGHGGTLDPMATGVLPLALGKATRLLAFLPERKVYQAQIRFGVQTTTDDLEGEILRQQSATNLTLEQIEPLLKFFLGSIEQVPPAYSAIQRDGQRLYELARRGEVVVVPPRQVFVYEIEVLSWTPGEFPELELRIECGPGTYIRAIARDLGDRLGTGGTLAGLIRSSSCGLNLRDSLTFEELEAQKQGGTFVPIRPVSLLTHLPQVNLGEEQGRRWCQGQRVPCEVVGDAVCVLDEGGILWGIGEARDGELIPKIVIGSS